MDVARGHISMLGCNMDMEAISTCFEVIMDGFWVHRSGIGHQ